jgi:Do/DeqQ family serine protease
MNFKNILAVMAISASTAVVSVWGYGKFVEHQFAGVQDPSKLPVNYAGFFGDKAAPGTMVDFTPAATSATPAVVHIKTRTKARQVSNSQRQRNPFADLFGGGDDAFGDVFGGPRVIPEQRASGSGVLITEDGYIVTNNHVVDGADEINVTLANKKSYKASVIGADPSSDIAVLKIEGKGLPYLVYGNSDDAKLGQWVLAIGYPLNLDVTVTAGIISAKARNIGIINPNNGENGNNKSSSPVESFIQTDAAVNPGNSGGALINLNGEVIGINSAIASQNGSYIGYSYAIPMNIAKKVVNDIIKYGTVQRAYLGLSYAQENLSDEQKKAAGVKEGEGVYITDVLEGGGAAAAGIKKGDFITKINGANVTSAPEMVEQIARLKPGDKTSITYTRDGKENTTTVTLKNKLNTTNVVKSSSVFEKLGGEFATVDKKVAKENEIEGGVIIKKVGTSILKKSRIQDGFVITSINGIEIKTLEDFNTAMKNARGTVFFEGIYPGFTDAYRYPIKLDEE